MTERSVIANPLPATPVRRPGSARRTSHLDMLSTDGGGLRIIGVARDLVTGPDGSASVTGQARVDAQLDEQRLLATLDTDPGDDATRSLHGLLVGPGFRAAGTAALPAEHAACTPLAMLLDDLPVAALISTYAHLYSGAINLEGSRDAVQADICSGWRADGAMVTSIRAGRGLPVPVGPPVTSLDCPGDDLAWHDLDPLPPTGMRRRRLVEVAATEAEPQAWAMFRDSHVDDEGNETVLHEYTVTAEIDAGRTHLVSCEATPLVLPWGECPEAAASAERLAGVALADIRDVVRTDFRGITTCTHLNDLLRSLGDLAALVQHI